MSGRTVAAFLAVTAGAVLVAFVSLWLLAGRDLGYLIRVLHHRDAGTDDHQWKASVEVGPADRPVPWPRAPARCDACAAVTDAAGTQSLVVVRDGAIVHEWYGNGGASDRPAAAFSVSKTVVSLLLARAGRDRAVDLDDAITTWIPELAERDGRFEAITLADLVDMRSGIGFDETTRLPWVNQDAPAVYYASDLTATVLDRSTVVAPPGGFLYNDYNPNLLGIALERATGTGLAEATRQLWSDIGAEHPASWSVDDAGFAWHESGLVATATDLARIGQLVLDEGRVGSVEVAPPGFVDRSTDPAGTEPVTTFGGVDVGYRNGWWVLADTAGGHDLVAMGRHGQVMVVSPDTGTVVVRMGTDATSETNIEIARRLQAITEP